MFMPYFITENALIITDLLLNLVFGNLTLRCEACECSNKHGIRSSSCRTWKLLAPYNVPSWPDVSLLTPCNMSYFPDGTFLTRYDTGSLLEPWTLYKMALRSAQQTFLQLADSVDSGQSDAIHRTGTWLEVVWVPLCLCYRPTVFFRHLHVITLSYCEETFCVSINEVIILGKFI